MAELRYNPITKDWVMVASHRQARPTMPKDWCPFCPGSGRVPEEGYGVLRYPNDFPALSPNPPEPDDVAGGIFKTSPAYGRCEVLLYSDRHTATLAELDDGHVEALARMWQDCYRDFSRDGKIKYIFIFENRGEMVGVTMPHPHGQVYGYPFVPKKIAGELAGAADYHATHGRCVFCELLDAERRDGRRLVFENQHFSAYLPFFGATSYGMHVTARRHLPHLGAMTDAELRALGTTVRDCAGLYDSLFDKPFPYMMCMHNAPPGGAHDDHYHFHIEFFTTLRAESTQQFFASSETGADAWCNPNCPEEKAEELRAAHRRYLDCR